MRVIVCGAGLVGSNIAQYLSAEGNQVTLIETDAEVAANVRDSMDVQTVVGQAFLPDVLNAADASNCDMIVAVTQYDEINIVACQVAQALFNVPTRIARIRNQSFLKPTWSNLFSPENIPIDTIISPEIEVARAIVRRLHVPGAFDTQLMADDRVRMVGVTCTADTPVINTPLRQLITLFPNLNAVILAIIRNERAFIPGLDDMLLDGDSVYMVCDNAQTARLMEALGHSEPEARHIVIAGGGNIGSFLAELIEKEFPQATIRMIERDAGRAQAAAQHLSRTIVLKGDALDIEILEEARIGETETIVCVANDDETNILASLLARRHGCKRAITLVNKPSFSSIVTMLGVDSVINPRSITVSRILQSVRRGRIRSIYTIRDGFAELIEAEALESSPIINVPLGDIKLPEGVVLGAIMRNGQVFRPDRDTIVKAHDRVVLLASITQIKKVERLFAARADYY